VARYAEVTPPEIKSDIKFGAASQENNAWLRISQRRAP